jgi:protein-S-isoprenylcysteine O-methyltransferase Ste14
MEKWGLIAQKIRVPMGTVMGVIFLLLMHPSRRSIWLGAIVAFPGAALRVWAAGHIVKGKILAQDGPYALTRNPLYLGSFIMALGILLGGQGYWLLIPFSLFFAVLYYPVMKAEERELINGHGEEFQAYVRRVPFFFPSFKMMPGSPSTFLWARVIKNREHRTLTGLLLTESFLVCLALKDIHIASSLASLFLAQGAPLLKYLR